ncbi:hypothetical protein SprV_0401544500 [Sparganum proliferum]
MPGLPTRISRTNRSRYTLSDQCAINSTTTTPSPTLVPVTNPAPTASLATADHTVAAAPPPPCTLLQLLH